MFKKHIKGYFTLKIYFDTLKEKYYLVLLVWTSTNQYTYILEGMLMMKIQNVLKFCILYNFM